MCERRGRRARCVSVQRYKANINGNTLLNSKFNLRHSVDATRSREKSRGVDCLLDLALPLSSGHEVCDHNQKGKGNLVRLISSFIGAFYVTWVLLSMHLGCRITETLKRRNQRHKNIGTPEGYTACSRLFFIIINPWTPLLIDTSIGICIRLEFCRFRWPLRHWYLEVPFDVDS
jgi:hypothetical protein